jgi:hypothetical protein
MRSCLLWHDPLPEPESVVRWFGAMQAQDYEPAKWAVAMRSSGAGDAELDRAVDEGRILRTHALRPTWHFVLPEDIGWIQMLTGPRVHVLNGHYYRINGLDERFRGRCQRLITRWLEADGELTRAEIGQRLKAEGIEAAGPRLAYIVMSAELNGVICSGKRSGATHTYDLVSGRAKGASKLSEDEALAELSVRYFRSHGPATVGDFRWWSSLTVAQIRRGLELAGDRLVRESVGDLELWSADPDPLDSPSSPTVHILQPYDEYTVAFSDTKSAVNIGDEPPEPPVVEGRAFYNAVIIDGHLAGWWRRVLGRARIEIEVRPVRKLSRPERRALESAAAGYGRFHDLSVTVDIA